MVSRGSAVGDTPNSGKKRRDSVAGRAPAGLRLYAQLGLRVPEELALRLRRHCHASGKSVNGTVMEALDRYLGENGR
jgi:predicted HicB family RNase H-like nuclease